MNKIKVTLSESNPPRIGDELTVVYTCARLTNDCAIFHARFGNGHGHTLAVTMPLADGMVVTRTEEEDGA